MKKTYLDVVPSTGLAACLRAPSSDLPIVFVLNCALFPAAPAPLADAFALVDGLAPAALLPFIVVDMLNWAAQRREEGGWKRHRACGSSALGASDQGK